MIQQTINKETTLFWRLLYSLLQTRSEPLATPLWSLRPPEGWASHPPKSMETVEDEEEGVVEKKEENIVLGLLTT